MIRVEKPDAPPARLRTHGATKRDALITAYGADPATFVTRSSSDLFDSETYGHREVKDALATVQHGKCCFCESKVQHISYGDVEHFRPKAGWSQDEADDLHKPGYFWLAYAWSNLFLCCQLCNQRFKRNLFPLVDPSQRADPTIRDISAEQPVMLNPSIDDPEEHIGFRDEIAYGKTDRGEHTIDLLGLNREAMVEHRREALARVQRILELLIHFGQDLHGPEVATALDSFCAPTEQYASMMRCLMATVRDS